MFLLTGLALGAIVSGVLVARHYERRDREQRALGKSINAKEHYRP